MVRRVGAHEHDRVGVAVAAARCAIGALSVPRSEDRRRVREEQAVLLGERCLRLRVESLVRVADAAREREVARRRAQTTNSDDEREQAEQDQAPPRPALRQRGSGAEAPSRTPMPARSRRGLAARSARLPGRARRNLALRRVRPGRRGRASRPAPSGEVGYPAELAGKRVIGVDLGGTKILAGVVDAAGRVERTLERPTPTGRRRRSSTRSSRSSRSCGPARSRRSASALPTRDRPGDGDRTRRRQHPAARRSRCATSSMRRLGLPVGAVNDASAAALAELRLGAGAGRTNSSCSRSAPASAAASCSTARSTAAGPSSGTW